MKTKSVVTAAAGLMLVAAATGAIAQTAPRSGSPAYSMPYERNFWSYAGASVGRSDYDIGCAAGFACDTRATGFKLFAGGKMSEFLGLEASYVWLGNAKRAGGDTTGQGVNLSLVGTLPLGQSVGLNAKVGGLYGWTDTESVTRAFAGGHDRGFGYSYGAGLTVALTRTVDLRLDWDRYRMEFKPGRDDVDLASVGVQFKF